ncbi:MAG TPA: NfeD family protein [Caulobacteraceae bacterium]|nr:NfeD family protein [Caulobacteraceae bacterium]
MDALADLYAAQPFWIWLALGAILLAVEAAVGTEWLLWPAASAAVVALVTLTPAPLNLGGEIVLFAALTLVTTFVGRRFVTRVQGDGPDINDQPGRLVGQAGQTASDIVAGRGRVFAGGAEWPAELEGGGDLPAGTRVVVTGVSGAALTVRAVA